MQLTCPAYFLSYILKIAILFRKTEESLNWELVLIL